MPIAVRTLSKMLVEVHEDKHITDHDTKSRRDLVKQLDRIGIPVVQCEAAMPVDVMWSIDGEPCMWDLKTSQDFIASAEDGRLHKQMQAMEEKGCSLYGFVLEDEISRDGGITVGYGTHAWAAERFDNLVLSIQCEGAKVVRSLAPQRTATRLAALYRWSGKVERASWRRPMAPSYSLNRLYGNKAYRSAVEGLMALLPGCGEERAVALLQHFTLAEILDPVGGPTRWPTVRGIGKTLSEAWQRKLQGDFREG